MIRHYDMHTGEPIGAENASQGASEPALVAEHPAARLMTLDEAIAEERRNRSPQPAIVMLTIDALLAKHR